MKFNVIGADRDTGDDIELTFDAVDESAAHEIVHRKGIMVSRIAAVKGYSRTAPVLTIASPPRGDRLGVASLMIGILALICLIPFVNQLSFPLSALGLLLGLIGLPVALIRKRLSIGYPIAGVAVCGLALFVVTSRTDTLLSILNNASEGNPIVQVGSGNLGESLPEAGLPEAITSPHEVDSEHLNELVREAERRDATNQTTAAPIVQDGGSSERVNKLAAQFLYRASRVKTPEDEWASAETPVRQGDVHVQVKAVRVGKVPLRAIFGDRTGESQNVHLMIELEVTNLSDTKKLNYNTWSGSWDGSAMSFGHRTALTDNFDNEYRETTFGSGDLVVGAITSKSIYPGKSVRDMLVFEEPVGRAEHLNLELPAMQFGGEGMLRIRIPASWIQK